MTAPQPTLDVSTALTAVLNAKKPDGSPQFSFEDFQATFPPMILSLMGHVPFEQMAPEAQELAVLAMGQVGLEVTSSPADIEAKVTDYVARHPPNQDLLAAIQGVLVHAFTKAEDAVVKAGRELTGEKLNAPKLHEKRPDGAVDVRALQPRIKL